ncbi:MAG: hypothetical protein ACOC3Z_01470, partial [Nanoarchaeota archaeon]
MINTIKVELDNYLEFDSSKLFNSTDFIVVFGGALRDIIASDSGNIKDIDIMCLPKSRDIASRILLSNGYKNLDLFSSNLFCLYKDIKCIFEPKTFVKGSKIVQLITPAVYGINDFNRGRVDISHRLQENFFNILKNVDLSSSGVVYNGRTLYETIKGTIGLIKNKKYFHIPNALMYNEDRIIMRDYNLIHKGWEKIKLEDNILFERMIKIL